MPHIVVEYSANLEPDVSVRRLVDEVHKVALGTGVFPLGGTRTRAERRDVYAVADGNPEHVFVAILARIAAGRDEATRRRVAEDLLRVLERETAELFRTRGVALSVDLQETDPANSAKTNNLHERLKKEDAA